MRRLFVHLDLNRTVVMSDAVGGRSMENVVNYLLSEICWGKESSRSQQDTDWEPAHSVPEPNRSVLSADHLVTYKQYIDRKLPYLSIKSDAESIPEGFADVMSFNRSQKKKRTALQSDFTKRGSPGEIFQPIANQVMDKLSLPPAKKSEALRAADCLPDGRVKESFIAGKHYLLRSFLNLLIYISENHGEGSKLPISIVLRTFGDDVPELTMKVVPSVAQEIQLLCNGQHPLFPNMKLDDRMLLKEPYNVFFRAGASALLKMKSSPPDGFGSDGLLMATGTSQKVPAQQAKSRESALNFYEQLPGVTVSKGFKEAKAKIKQMALERSVIALRDYWEWWSAHGEGDEYGKILLVDDLENSDGIMDIVFDDHIEHDHAHIIDARYVSSGEPVPFAKAINHHLYRAEPYLAITDDQYFIKQIQSITDKILSSTC